MAQQLYGAAEGQAHDGVVVALDAVQPQRRAALDGISAGLIIGFLNIQIELFSLQGIYKPVYAIKSSNPVVFKHTVLPPVFGPVMIKQLKSCPNLISIGTILFLSING